MNEVKEAVRDVIESAVIAALIKLPSKNVQILDEDLADCKGFFQSTSGDFGNKSLAMNTSQLETSSSEFKMIISEKKYQKNGQTKKKSVFLKTKAQ